MSIEKKLIMKNFSFTQKIYIDIIEKYKKENYGEIPSIRKLAKMVGVNSSSTVWKMLRKLKEKGYNYKENTNDGFNFRI